MGRESPAVAQLKAIADQIDALNTRLEEENARLRAAIILLTAAVDVILPQIVGDKEVIERARAANEAARLAVTDQRPS